MDGAWWGVIQRAWRRGLNASVSEGGLAGTRLRAAAEVLLLGFPFLLLDPVLAGEFEQWPEWFTRVSPVVLYLSGTAVGVTAWLALGRGVVSLAVLCLCLMLVRSSALGIENLDEPFFKSYPELVRHSVTRFAALSWGVLLLWTSGRERALSRFRLIVAAFGVAHIGAVAVQLGLLQFGGTSVFLDSGLWLSSLSVRSGDTIYHDALRLSGLFRNPNLLGIALVLVWPAVIVWGGRPGVTGCFMLTWPFLAAAGTAASYSRAAYLGLLTQITLMLGLLAWLVWSCRRERKTLPPCWQVLAGASAAAAAGFVAVLQRPNVAGRVAAIADGADQSIRNRLGVWTDGLRELLDSPWCGWGSGSFYSMYNRLVRPLWISYDNRDAHSTILNALYELGFAGCILVFGAVASPALFRLAGRKSSEGGGHLPADDLMPFWALLGLAGALIPLAAENVGAAPGVLIPLLACGGALVTAGARNERQLSLLVRRRAGVAVAAVFGSWWLMSALPPPAPRDRLEAALKQQAGRESGVEWYFHDAIRDWRISSLRGHELADAAHRMLADHAGELNTGKKPPRKVLHQRREFESMRGVRGAFGRVEKSSDREVCIVAVGSETQRWVMAVRLPRSCEEECRAAVSGLFWRCLTFLDPECGLFSHPQRGM